MSNSNTVVYDDNSIVVEKTIDETYVAGYKNGEMYTIKDTVLEDDFNECESCSFNFISTAQIYTEYENILTDGKHTAIEVSSDGKNITYKRIMNNGLENAFISNDGDIICQANIALLLDGYVTELEIGYVSQNDYVPYIFEN